MTNLYLIKTWESAKVAAIAYSREATGDDFGVLYKAFEKFVEINSEVLQFTQAISVYRNQVTPQGIPYTYDLCYDGGLYQLWNLGSKELITPAKDYLRRSFDVVTLGVNNLELIQWTPPAPFESIDLPEWITFESKETL